MREAATAKCGHGKHSRGKHSHGKLPASVCSQAATLTKATLRSLMSRVRIRVRVRVRVRVWVRVRLLP